MESAAPPGGVMLSDSTARLVESAVVLGASESVYIKNVHSPVGARRVLAVGEHRPGCRTESKLVGGTQHRHRNPARGRRCRMCGQFDGPAGIGQSRQVREAAAIAATRGAPVYTTYT
ncbi:MAG: hypothetical protein JOZ49_05585 [Mycolicibacterium sp.]|nr:hypothetical protein [Mycolicibacterium sp.]